MDKCNILMVMCMLYDISFSDGSPKVYRKADSLVATDIEVLEVGYNKVPPPKNNYCGEMCILFIT